VRTIRIWLLLLLAVLLPVRGAVAAAMLCPMGGSGSQMELRLNGDSSAHHALDESMAAAEHASAHEHSSAQHDHPGGHHDHGGGQADKCNLCSAFCSLTPMVSPVLDLPQQQDLATPAFPDVSALAPTFLSDGQERPPRSI